MPGQVLIAGYQIGYRVKGIGGYTEPYTDLPMHRADSYADAQGFVCAAYAELEAHNLLSVLKRDFPHAEWRVLECWE
jgi:hypothetical protein